MVEEESGRRQESIVRRLIAREGLQERGQPTGKANIYKKCERFREKGLEDLGVKKAVGEDQMMTVQCALWFRIA